MLGFSGRGGGKGGVKRGKEREEKPDTKALRQVFRPLDEYDASPQIVANQNNFRSCNCHVSDDRCERYELKLTHSSIAKDSLGASDEIYKRIETADLLYKTPNMATEAMQTVWIFSVKHHWAEFVTRYSFITGGKYKPHSSEREDLATKINSGPGPAIQKLQDKDYYTIQILTRGAVLSPDALKQAKPNPNNMSQ